MDLYEAIAKRYSVRAYQDRPVEEDKLRRVLQAGVDAPSARNRQARRIIVVRDARVRAELVKAAGQEWMATAPIILAVVGLTPEDTMYCEVPTDPVDCAIAIDHMTLAAVAEGLGTCWIGSFNGPALQQFLGLPEDVYVCALTPLGYPEGEAFGEPVGRKAVEEIVMWERWEER